MRLLFALVAIFVALGVAPTSREVWLLENVLPIVMVAVLIVTIRHFRFSKAAYACFFAFLALHEIGAHYTYTLVPYEHWIASFQGLTLGQLLGWQRNQYDRMIHFACGLLLLVPTIELMRAFAPPRSWWRFVQAPSMILAGSALYALIEWSAALILGGRLGEAYLSTQGDTWDLQKDMVCVLAGALLCQLVILSRMPRRQLPGSAVRSSAQSS